MKKNNLSPFKTHRLKLNTPEYTNTFNTTGTRTSLFMNIPTQATVELCSKPTQPVTLEDAFSTGSDTLGSSPFEMKGEDPISV